MVDYESSMNISQEYRDKINCDEWNILKSLYEKKIFETNESYKIPKKIHQIWLGGELPRHLEGFVNQWKKISEENDWEYFFWKDDNISEFENYNIKLTKNNGQKSDIVRYEILKKYGGVYVDTDFVPIKIFDNNILNNDFFCGIAFGKSPILFNGLIGSIPNGLIINKLSNITKIDDTNHETIMETTGPNYLTSKFFEVDEDKIAYPFTYFYPFSNRSFDRNKGDDYKNYIKDETYCVHLWNCGWMK